MLLERKFVSSVLTQAKTSAPVLPDLSLACCWSMILPILVLKERAFSQAPCPGALPTLPTSLCVTPANTAQSSPYDPSLASDSAVSGSSTTDRMVRHARYWRQLRTKMLV